MTEILAPAGGMEALKAAIANGANAVYLGGKAFNARAYAANFNDDELKEAIDLAHFYGVRIYLALNILLNNEELPQALAYIAKAYKMGIDAVIIQDIGLLKALRCALPGLPIHGSTQMSLYNSAGVNLVAKQGVKRAILARELSLKELEQTKAKSDIPLEVFVHGALCICYSGQCYLSSFIGARSGNRGSCAQPCRLEYKLVDENGEQVPNKMGEHLLSPRDLYGYLNLPDLYKLGIASWKIEGRMKRPEYVAIVTRIYRHLLDALENQAPMPDQKQAMDELLQVFNRDYSTGYWLGNPGAELMSYQRPNNRGVFLGRITALVEGQITIKLESPLQIGDGLEVWVKVGGRQGFTVSRIIHQGIEKESAQSGEIVVLDFFGRGKIGDRVFKTSDYNLLENAKASWESLPPIPLKMEITAFLGQALRVTAQDGDGHFAAYEDEYIVEAAQTSPADINQVKAQLGRLGGSNYYLEELKGEIAENAMLPKSVLNRCRRALVSELKNKRFKPYSLPQIDEKIFAQALREINILPPESQGKRKALPKLTVLASEEESLFAAIKGGAKELYLTGESHKGFPKNRPFKELLTQAEKKGCKLIPSLPQIFHEGQESYWLKQIQEWDKAGAEGILIPSLGALGLAKKYGWSKELYADSGLNVFNRQSALFLHKQGVSRVLLSGELNLSQLLVFGALPLGKELVVHGASQLMLSEYCPLGALKGGRGLEAPCSSPCMNTGRFALKDAKGFTFPCRMDQSCRLHLFNSRELCLAEDINKLRQANIEYLRLDLRLIPAKNVLRLISIYQDLINGNLKYEDVKDELAALSLCGYTKGHLYRGV